MTVTLADFSPLPAPVTQQPFPFVLIGRYPSAAAAVDIAFQNRRTHPEEPVEIWPVDGSDDRIVVREVLA